jgi:hypothetical protein
MRKTEDRDDVKALMRDPGGTPAPNAIEEVGSYLGSRFRERPRLALKLLAIKAARSWYGMTTFRFEKYLAALQSLYLLTATWGLGLAWKRGGRGANLATMTLLVGLYFWLVTIMVLSVLRYMVPVMALLFIFSALAISRVCGRGGRGVNLATMTLLVGLYFWLVTMMALSVIRKR